MFSYIMAFLLEEGHTLSESSSIAFMIDDIEFTLALTGGRIRLKFRIAILVD